jgi:hypothetical protein
MISVTTEQTNEKQPEFPKLMKSVNSGVIVLFSDKQCGTVLTLSEKVVSDYPVGKYATDFIMTMFEDYNESVIIKNT